MTEHKPQTRVDDWVERTQMDRQVVHRLLAFCGDKGLRPEKVLTEAVDQYLKALGV